MLQQKKDFAEQKVIDTERETKMAREREEEQMKSMKERMAEELAGVQLRAANERKLYDEKLEKVKKANNETEGNLMRQLADISRLKAIDEQKLENL